eukprot:CAMPEP_0114133554 /NCGR_PEP_ID=MMETSP0043_2-20121206/13691_1 /TAXON_ID=464988 /ORGANISM="Hemiselmis andersenii, Strain CCMP644" /LENGTH=114 /DNA_ID=CAMNT_0001227145 /DNA_START=814 /DNA_END=1155 /DNA_ORIENTATION=-
MSGMRVATDDSAGVKATIATVRVPKKGSEGRCLAQGFSGAPEPLAVRRVLGKGGAKGTNSRRQASPPPSVKLVYLRLARGGSNRCGIREVRHLRLAFSPECQNRAHATLCVQSL